MYAVALTGVGDGLVVGLTGEIARSTNGTTFTLLDPPGYSVKGDFSCPAAGLCYAASKLGRIYKSTDNGATWSMITTGTGKWLWGIDCTSSNTCWVVGDGGEIWYTNNGFQSLQRQQTTIPATTIFKRVDMVDAQHGYAVGEGGVIYRTDNGSTWQQMPAFTTANLEDVFAHSMDDVFVADWDGKIWHGTHGSRRNTDRDQHSNVHLHRPTLPTDDFDAHRIPRQPHRPDIHVDADETRRRLRQPPRPRHPRRPKHRRSCRDRDRLWHCLRGSRREI